MKQEKIYTSSEVNQLLDLKFKEFTGKWHGVVNMSDIQTLAKFIESVKDEVGKNPLNLA